MPIALVVLAFVLLGGSKPAPAQPTPQASTPTPQPGDQTALVVGAVLQGAADLFAAYLNQKP